MGNENLHLTKGERTRTKILEKAADLFSEKGYTAVTMKDVCEATGLSRGGLYRYFGSTAEMMMLLMRAEQEHADRQAEREHGEHRSAVSMLDAFLMQHYHFMLSRRGRLDQAGQERNQPAYRHGGLHKQRIVRNDQRIGMCADCGTNAGGGPEAR